MIKLKIISVGKTKESWLEEAINEYLKRLKPYASIEFLWAKNDSQLIDWTSKENSVLCLDPLGMLFDSSEFSHVIHQKIQEGGARLAFVIGGAEGLPSQLRDQYTLLSLSPMTYTHQITRLVLIEQIYRAFEIAKGTKYHK
jgi:23S rRNA (pseudouridine1915-N3)-methyltransferase